MDREALQAIADELGPHWWHSIDLGQGVTTDGTKSIEVMRAEVAALHLPEDLSGRTVLDIGAWDGGFSFECERRGADVTALDHYIWSIDLDEKAAYSGRCAEQGIEPRPFEEVPEVWKPDLLPGKKGFDLAKRALGSDVRAVVGELERMDLDELGSFDIVLYLGVLYHVLDPFEALKRLARVTGELAVIETEMIRLEGAVGGEELSLFEFLPGSALNQDPTNYWVPSIAGLTGLCRAAGFRTAHTFVAPAPEPAPAEAARVPRLKQVVKAALGRVDPTPRQELHLARYRAVTHARK